MPACSGGAEVRPGLTAVNLILSVANAGLVTVGGLPELIPWVFDNPVLGSVVASGLCNANPDDPGDFNPSMLFPPAVYGTLPGPQQPPGTLMRWIWDKVWYWTFQNSCQCISTAQPPPAPVPVTPITNYDTTVNNTTNNTQLTNIEVHQEVGGDQQKQLYNGLQHVSSINGELFVRHVPGLVQPGGYLASGITGEGIIDIPISNYPLAEPFSPSFSHLVATVDQLGPKVGIRGSLNPRIYGIGSLYFDAQYQGGSEIRTYSRHSIHYMNQVIPFPRETQIYRVSWRLMPENVVSLRLVGYATDNVMLAPTAGDQYGWLPFANLPAPPSWSDPPIYPGVTLASSAPSASAANPCGCPPS